jgi:hypothetical protein
MKLRRLTMISLAAVVAGSVLVFQASLADDTNAAPAGTIDFEFINAPCDAVALWLARLTAEPVIVPVNANIQVTYRTQKKLTREEAIQSVTALLQTNGLSVVNMKNRYYRVVGGSATGPVVDRPHIDVEVQNDRFLVNGSPVDRKDLSPTLARLLTPETEVWVHHSGPKSQPSSATEAAEMFRSVPGLNADKIYLECMPTGI